MERTGSSMNCWHCHTRLIWGGDHDIEEEDENYSIGVNLNVSIADVILNFRVNNLLHRLPIDGDYSIRTHELFNPVNSMISFGILWEFDD